MLVSLFKFHPIGQGCFYTGHLRSSKMTNPFNFVYDCGTYSKFQYLEEAMDNHIDIFLPDNYLDLLMISHFDADHINGVVRLLERVQVGHIIIPYYQPFERLLLYATSDYPDDDYRLFLQSPLGFLSSDRFRVNQILVIGGPPGEESPETFENTEIFPPENSDRIPLDNIDEITINFESQDEDINDRWIDQVEREEGSDIKGSNIKFLQKPYQFNIKIWEFIFYQKKYDNVVLMYNFTVDVNNLLYRRNLTFKDLFNEDNVSELKDYYRKYYGRNLNATSLVTFHGPLVQMKHAELYNTRIDNYNRYGSLLTGDICLQSQRDTVRLLDYFGNRLNDILFFQVPHHGSEHNWNFHSPNGYDGFIYYIINHGLGRSHHPSSKVIDYIIQNSRQAGIMLNNEVYNIDYLFED
jgi:hypothetical protein